MLSLATFFICLAIASVTLCLYTLLTLAVLPFCFIFGALAAIVFAAYTIASTLGKYTHNFLRFASNLSCDIANVIKNKTTQAFSNVYTTLVQAINYYKLKIFDFLFFKVRNLDLTQFIWEPSLMFDRTMNIVLVKENSVENLVRLFKLPINNHLEKYLLNDTPKGHSALIRLFSSRTPKDAVVILTYIHNFLAEKKLDEKQILKIYQLQDTSGHTIGDILINKLNHHKNLNFTDNPQHYGQVIRLLVDSGLSLSLLKEVFFKSRTYNKLVEQTHFIEKLEFECLGIDKSDLSSLEQLEALITINELRKSQGTSYKEQDVKDLSDYDRSLFRFKFLTQKISDIGYTQLSEALKDKFLYSQESRQLTNKKYAQLITSLCDLLEGVKCHFEKYKNDKRYLRSISKLLLETTNRALDKDLGLEQRVKELSLISIPLPSRVLLTTPYDITLFLRQQYNIFLKESLGSMGLGKRLKGEQGEIAKKFLFMNENWIKGFFAQLIKGIQSELRRSYPDVVFNDTQAQHFNPNNAIFVDDNLNNRILTLEYGDEELMIQLSNEQWANYQKTNNNSKSLRVLEIISQLNLDTKQVQDSLIESSKCLNSSEIELSFDKSFTLKINAGYQDLKRTQQDLIPLLSQSAFVCLFDNGVYKNKKELLSYFSKRNELYKKNPLVLFRGLRADTKSTDNKSVIYV